ncbi:hypothetical protein Dsin_013012 [Dipteronia sinensis]|uniref:H(+)-exporting diphosphatase n=1 Tax=Dipteronia sinensis TaxID=43782 RepID=A0AAE0AKG4_9ROSI|nr:hypothetical protein Dsin_013012 [Dipteronia sinensis]
MGVSYVAQLIVFILVEINLTCNISRPVNLLVCRHEASIEVFVLRAGFLFRILGYYNGHPLLGDKVVAALLISKLFAALEVGDNVSKCAAQGADLFESIAAEIISAMILGGTMAQPCRIEKFTGSRDSQAAFDAVYLFHLLLLSGNVCDYAHTSDMHTVLLVLATKLLFVTADDAPQETFLFIKEFSFISFTSSLMCNLMIWFDSSKLFAALEVGDNVSKCAAQGADLFESIAAEIISAMILGGTMAQPCRIES